MTELDLLHRAAYVINTLVRESLKQYEFETCYKVPFDISPIVLIEQKWKQWVVSGFHVPGIDFEFASRADGKKGIECVLKRQTRATVKFEFRRVFRNFGTSGDHELWALNSKTTFKRKPKRADFASVDTDLAKIGVAQKLFYD